LFKTFVLGGGKKIQHIEGEHTVQSLQVLISTNKRQAWLQRRKNTQASLRKKTPKLLPNCGEDSELPVEI
jgi:hypothetical protein